MPAGRVVRGRVVSVCFRFLRHVSSAFDDQARALSLSRRRLVSSVDDGIACSVSIIFTIQSNSTIYNNNRQFFCSGLPCTSTAVANLFVKKLSGLAQLSSAAVDALEAATERPKPFAARQDIIREGDLPGPVLIVIDGWACRYKILPNGSRQIMAFMMAGDSCDLHISMLSEMDHSIQAVTSAQIAMISRGEMDDLMRGHPSIARAMYISQLIDEGTLRAWIVSMGRRNSQERVAHLMCELYIRANAIGLARDGEVALPLSQLILADALGMTPVHINRILKELRLDGAMALRRGSLIIQDPVKLVRIAGFDENYLHRREQRTA